MHAHYVGVDLVGDVLYGGVAHRYVLEARDERRVISGGQFGVDVRHFVRLELSALVSLGG